MIRNQTISIVMVAGLCALALIGCDRKPDQEGGVSGRASAAPIAASAQGTEAIVPSAWKTVSEADWSFDLPLDWAGDAGMYYPEELADRLAAGVWPHTVCQIGSRVIASDGTVEDELEALFGPGPWTMTPVTVCDADGHLLEASDAGRMHLSLVFEFETLTSTSSVEVPAIEVFVCSTASSRFGQYEAVFRRILESTRCRTD